MSWGSLPFVSLDGENWPLSFAAMILDVPEPDLRRRVRKEKVEPAGVIRMSEFRRSGRQPMAYPAGKLIMLAEAIQAAQREREEKENPRSA
jgi:hypothetical protein